MISDSDRSRVVLTKSDSRRNYFLLFVFSPNPHSKLQRCWHSQWQIAHSSLHHGQHHTANECNCPLRQFKQRCRKLQCQPLYISPLCCDECWHRKHLVWGRQQNEGMDEEIESMVPDILEDQASQSCQLPVENVTRSKVEHALRRIGGPTAILSF